MAASFLRAGLDVEDDPFISGILHNVQASLLDEMKRRARIPVPNTYLLFGIIDETGTLEENEIFVQMKDHLDPSGSVRIMKGRVLIGRSPALHPGDLRMVEAVECPELSHLFNCVVFSSRGSRPLPNMLSGGDLDGDDYFVSTNPALFLPRDNHAAMDYTPRKPIEVPRVTIPHIVDFFIEFMRNDRLGMIDNCHLALADDSGFGALDERCLKLAQMHSDAVDFAKTGVSAPPLGREFAIKEYPDYMNKKKKRGRGSSKLLGILWHSIGEQEAPVSVRAGRREYRSDVGRRFDDDVLLDVDSRFLFPGYEDHVEEACAELEYYVQDFTSLMYHHGVPTEAEMVSGRCRKVARLYRTRRLETQNRINDATEALTRNYYRTFKESCSHHGNGEARTAEDDVDSDEDEEEGENNRHHRFDPHSPLTKMKASAWYYAAYTREYEADEKIILSFGWIAKDILLRIFEENVNQ